MYIFFLRTDYISYQMIPLFLVVAHKVQVWNLYVGVSHKKLLPEV